MKNDYHLDLPRRLQIEFSQVVQNHTDEQGGEFSSADLWQIFEDEKNISIHLKDLKPEIYAEFDEKHIKEHTFKYFDEYPIALIKEKLKDFFEIIR
jgi:isopropylmalate/homocitrate/citramalate synthase